MLSFFQSPVTLRCWAFFIFDYQLVTILFLCYFSKFSACLYYYTAAFKIAELSYKIDKLNLPKINDLQKQAIFTQIFRFTKKFFDLIFS